MPNSKTNDLFPEARVIIVGGVGGVGKTTLSASIALSQALRGKRVAVLTIDPARRLGAALGFKGLTNRLQTVPSQKLKPLGIAKGGSLSAGMLDAKSTFDDMVFRYAPSEEVARRIIQNQLYEELSQALSGTHEFMALEKIFEIHSSGEFDLLVLDTPPASAMQDFLTAPSRVAAFFDREIVRWFVGGSSMSGIGKGMEWAFSLFKKLSGGTLFTDILEFMADFQSLFEGIRSRAEMVNQLLKSPSTSYLLVTTADSIPLAEAQEMARSLEKDAFEIGAVLLNRAVPMKAPKISTPNPIEKELIRLASLFQKRQRSAEAELKKIFGGVPILRAPLMEKDPTSLSELALLTNMV